MEIIDSSIVCPHYYSDIYIYIYHHALWFTQNRTHTCKSFDLILQGIRWWKEVWEYMVHNILRVHSITVCEYWNDNEALKVFNNNKKLLTTMIYATFKMFNGISQFHLLLQYTLNKISLYFHYWTVNDKTNMSINVIFIKNDYCH